HNWMVALFPEAAQAEVFADPRALTASVFRMGGKTVPAPGGYRMTEGEGRFCSGIDHSQWVVLGNAVQRPEGPEPRFLLVPRSDAAAFSATTPSPPSRAAMRSPACSRRAGAAASTTARACSGSGATPTPPPPTPPSPGTTRAPTSAATCWAWRPAASGDRGG